MEVGSQNQQSSSNEEMFGWPEERSFCRVKGACIFIIIDLPNMQIVFLLLFLIFRKPITFQVLKEFFFL